MLSSVKNLDKFKKKDYDLCVDIGGTNSRVNFKCENEFFRILTFASKRMKEMEKIFSEMINELLVLLGKHPNHVCISFACPVPDNFAETILYFHPVSTGMDLENFHFSSVFPKSTLLSLNDLEAGAYGILKCIRDKNIDKYFKNSFLNKPSEKDFFYNNILNKKSIGIFCKGTGLGVGILYKLRFPNIIGDVYEVMPSETCWVQPPYPFENPEEIVELMKFVKKFRKLPLRFDYIAGGEVINTFYHFGLQKSNPEKYNFDDCSKLPEISASEIARMALEEDNKIAKRAIFYSDYFLVVASRLVSKVFPSLGAVFYCGDIQVKNSKLFKENMKNLHDVYMYYPLPWMKKMLGFEQIVSKNFNLEGCSYFIDLAKKRVK